MTEDKAGRSGKSETETKDAICTEATACLLDTLSMSNLREIAARVGLSKSAVSLALRGDVRIPPETRDRVAAAAKELGYRANPVIAHMMRSMRDSKSLRTRAALGILQGFPNPHPSRTVPYHAAWVAGARDRAEELGYVVNEFWLDEPGMSPRRLTGIIRSRGINALMIAPLPQSRALELDWEHFSAVTAGHSLESPRLNRVLPNSRRATLMCLHQLLSRGYRRIGLVLHDTLTEHTRFQIEAPYLWHQNRLGLKQPPPILPTLPAKPETFHRWLKRHRPDAIITTAGRCPDMLEACGLEIPDDIGLVSTSTTVARPGYCCVDQEPHRLGAAGIDLLIAQVNRGEFGVPANPRSVDADVSWRDGTSLRKVGPPLRGLPLLEVD